MALHLARGKSAEYLSPETSLTPHPPTLQLSAPLLSSTSCLGGVRDSQGETDLILLVLGDGWSHPEHCISV